MKYARFRKLSRKLHPDKNPSKQATERYARLGLVANIIRGPGKERYDYFLKHGFPTWRGTGYYMRKFRPGFKTVVVFLYLAAGAAHYAILSINFKRDRAHMRQVIDEVKQTAWSSTPVSGSTLDSTIRLPPIPPADGSSRKVVIRGRPFLIHADGRVFLIEPSSGQSNDSEYSSDAASDTGTGAVRRGERRSKKKTKKQLEREAGAGSSTPPISGPNQYELDETELIPPHLSNTLLVRLPIGIVKRAIGLVWESSSPATSETKDTNSNDTAAVSHPVPVKTAGGRRIRQRKRE